MIGQIAGLGNGVRIWEMTDQIAGPDNVGHGKPVTKFHAPVTYSEVGSQLKAVVKPALVCFTFCEYR
jgi:hypothetical protein